eukprot:758094-Hanusia_phi.AAC.1
MKEQAEQMEGCALRKRLQREHKIRAEVEGCSGAANRRGKGGSEWASGGGKGFARKGFYAEMDLKKESRRLISGDEKTISFECGPCVK